MPGINLINVPATYSIVLKSSLRIKTLYFPPGSLRLVCFVFSFSGVRTGALLPLRPVPGIPTAIPCVALTTAARLTRHGSVPIRLRPRSIEHETIKPTLHIFVNSKTSKTQRVRCSSSKRNLLRKGLRWGSGRDIEMYRMHRYQRSDTV